MNNYGAALYQNDVMGELVLQHNVFFYGPGFKLYNSNDTINDIIYRVPFTKPDVIIVGHSWLSDIHNNEVDIHPNLNLKKCKYPKVIILNKEYVNLDSKLNYIKNNEFNIAFTHHHNIDYFQNKTNIKFIYWPFAVNYRKMQKYNNSKIYDVYFSGILRNPNFPDAQSDIRLRIQKEIFYTVNNIAFKKRSKYHKYNISWNIYSNSPIKQSIRKLIMRTKHLTSDEYFSILNMSKICINTLSPLNLISTRYYESMAAKAMVFCQKSNLYRNLFDIRKHCIVFDDNLNDFYEKLNFYLTNEKQRYEITNAAFDLVLKKHTWEKRIKTLTEIINKI